MDDKERHKKVLAGKEKFAKLMKKKKNVHTSQDEKTKKRKVENSDNNKSRSSDDESHSQDDLITPSVLTKEGCDGLALPSTAKEDAACAESSVLLEGDAQMSVKPKEDVEREGRESALFMRQSEDKLLEWRKLDCDVVPDETCWKSDGECELPTSEDCDVGLKLKEYHEKIREFQSALVQRDDLIVQLSTSLQTTIAQRDVLQSEASQQSDALVLEIETLKLHLQQANEFLQNIKGKNGISAQELLDVRNELTSLQKSYAHKENQLEEVYRQLDSSGAEISEYRNEKKMYESKVKGLEEERNKANSLLCEKGAENERLKLDVERTLFEKEKCANDIAELTSHVGKHEEIFNDRINTLKSKHNEEIVTARRDQEVVFLEKEQLVSLLESEIKLSDSHTSGEPFMRRLGDFLQKVHETDLQRSALESELQSTKLLLCNTTKEVEAKDMRLKELEVVVQSLEDLHLERNSKENADMANQQRVIEDLRRGLAEKDGQLAVYTEKVISLEAHLVKCEQDIDEKVPKLELQLVESNDKVEELIQEIRSLSAKNETLQDELRRSSQQEVTGTFAAAVADLLDRCNMSDGSKLLALAKLAQDDSEGLPSWQASRDASIDWTECPSLPESVGGDRIGSGELDADELWRVELEHLLADLEAVDVATSSTDGRLDDCPRAKKDIVNLKMKMKHLAGCFINVLREKAMLEALVRDLKKAIELQQMARNKVELNEQEEKLGKGDFALEHGPWEQEKQMLELCIADLNSKNESHIAARENLMLDMELLREECAKLRQEKLLANLKMEDTDNTQVEHMTDVVQRICFLESENNIFKDKLMTASENNAILKSQVNRLREALAVRDQQENQLRQELDCCYERQRQYWRQRNVVDDSQMGSDMQQSLADLVDQVERKRITVSRGFTLGLDVDHKDAGDAPKELDSLSEYLVPCSDENRDEDPKVELTEEMVAEFVEMTVKKALQQAVLPENQALQEESYLTAQMHNEDIRKMEQRHSAQLEELEMKVDTLKATHLEELEQERLKIREEIINDYVNKFHVITQELETNHQVALEELQKSLNHDKCTNLEDHHAALRKLVEDHQHEVVTLKNEVANLKTDFRNKLEESRKDLMKYHRSQLEAVIADADSAHANLSLAHNQEMALLREQISSEFQQEIGKLHQEHENLDSANGHLRLLLTNIVRTYFVVAKNINKEFLSLLRNEAGSAGWDTKAGCSESHDACNNEPSDGNSMVDHDLREAVLSSIENGSELLDTSFLTVLSGDAGSADDVALADGIWFDPEHDEIVSEASSRLEVAVGQLLEMLSTTVQQLHEWRAGHVENESDAHQVEEIEELRSQLKDKENANGTLAKELNRVTEMVKSCERRSSELQAELEKKENDLQQILEQLDKAMSRQTELEQNIAEDQRLLEKQREIISEGLGEHEQRILDENSRLIKEKRGLQQQGEKDRSGLLSRIHELEQTTEELSLRNEELAEEKQRQTQDLKFQLEALEKQVKANRQFIEEQTVEREQEREEFQKGLQKLKGSLRDKERAIYSHADMSREVEALSEKLNDKAKKYHKLLERKNSLEKELKTTNECHHSQQEIIKELETQLDLKSHTENELIAQLDELRILLKQATKAEESLTSEIETLRAASMSRTSIDHIPFVNDLPKIHSPEMDDSHQINLMQELGLQLHVLEEKLEMRTRELEGLHVSTGSSIGSPCSEEISVRDQIAALRDANREDGIQGFQLSDLRHLEDKADALSRAAEAATRKIKDQDSIIRKQRQQEEELLQDKDALQQQLNTQLLQISSLQARLEEKRHGFMSASEMLEKISRLQLALEEEQEQSENRLRDVNLLNNQLDNAMQQLAMKERELNGYITQYNENIGSRESDNLIAKAELDALNTKNKSMEAMIVSLEKQVEDLSSLLQTLLKEKNEEIDCLTRHLQEFENNVSLSEVEKAETLELVQEICQLKLTLQEAEESVATLAKDLEQRDATVKRLNENIEEKLSTIDMLSSKLQHVDASLKDVTSRSDMETSSKDNMISEQAAQLECKGKDLKRAMEIGEQRRREVESLKVVLGEKQQLLEQVKTLKDEVVDLTDYQNRVTQELGSAQSQKLLLDKAIADRDEHINSLNRKLDELSNEEGIQQAKLREEITTLRRQLDILEREKIKDTREANVDTDLVISSHADSQTDFSDVIDELRNNVENMEAELQENRQKQEYLETERLMRDSQIARLVDQLEGANQNCVDLQEELKAAKTGMNVIEQMKKAVENATATNENVLQLNAVNNMTPTELSVTDSESDSLSGESVPIRVKSLMRNVHKEGIQMLTLSEVHFLRERATKEDGGTEPNLADAVGSLKDVLSQLMELLGTLENSNAYHAEWQQQLLQVISRILVREKQLMMTQLRTDARNLSLDQNQLKTIEEKITAMDVHHQTSLRDLARACQAYSVTSSFSDTQMAVAREKLQHQEEERKLLQQLSNMEQQLGQRERQMKRNLEMLDFRFDQEKLLADDLRATLDLEKSRAIELCSQLAQERSLTAQLEITLSQIRAELNNVRSAQDSQDQDLTSLRQAYECECTKNMMLQRALDGEKSNFSQLQEIMEAEKRRARAAQGREQQIIEELRKALENEKDKLLGLTDALEREKIALQTVRRQKEKSSLNRSKSNSDDNKNVNASHMSWPTDSTFVTLSETGGSNLFDASMIELQQWLEIEQRKVRELKYRLEQERNRVTILTETLQQERLKLMEELDIQRSEMQQAKASLNVLQVQKVDLQKEVLKERDHVVLLEADKERLLSMVGTLQEQVRKQEEQCESLRKMQHDLNRDSELEQERCRQNKQDIEMKMNRVEQELHFVRRELDVTRSSEKQLKMDLDRERQKSDTPGPAWNRLKEIRANGEPESESAYLCKQIANLDTLRQKLELLVIQANAVFTTGSKEMSALASMNSALPALLQELGQMTTLNDQYLKKFVTDGVSGADIIEKLVRHNSDLVAFIWNVNQEKQTLHTAVSQAEEELWKVRHKDPTTLMHQSSAERILAAERAAWTQERTRLQRALYKSDYELSCAKSRAQTPGGYLASSESPRTQIDDAQINSMYFKYLRSQSFRKNLIHQKQYLLVRLKRHQESEAHTLQVLENLGCLPSPLQLQQIHQPVCNRFKSVARAVMAISRMRYLIKRWSRVHGPSVAFIYGSSENGFDGGSSPHPSRHQRRTPYQVMTPPVRDREGIRYHAVPHSLRSASEHSSTSPAPRALSLQFESSVPSEPSLSEFIERFETLQQHLGIRHNSNFSSLPHT